MSFYYRNVLLADDDQDDRLFFEDAVRATGLDINLSSVKDGEKLMESLMNPEKALPDIVFLDLNMPCKNGVECLKEIREIAKFKNLVVVVYTTSGEERDIQNVFDLGATVFIRKPNDFEKLCRVIDEVLRTDWKQSGGFQRRFTQN